MALTPCFMTLKVPTLLKIKKKKTCTKYNKKNINKVKILLFKTCSSLTKLQKIY